ncbi:hypothetical protein EVAR_47211_1 [Eumeta japonica]|uniref:Reverse transcriptase domain-containing protein n=1 Tax=Eumeta variegata TaxID=151549 RepID=A0A4C1XY62_EUMVA|nr:hypothetical protein EVAR_47211_1 [Eumeta japonica]
MLVVRLNWQLTPTLHDTQYRFMPQRGTEDSLYDLMIRSHKKKQGANLVDEIKILGLTIDKRLTYIPQVIQACKKATNIYKGRNLAARTTCGLKLEILRTIYLANRANAPVCRVRLGTDGRVREAAWFYEVKRGKELGDISADWELENLSVSVNCRTRVFPGAAICAAGALAPDNHFERIESLDSKAIDRLGIEGTHIFTDGSHIQGKVIFSDSRSVLQVLTALTIPWSIQQEPTS